MPLLDGRRMRPPTHLVMVHDVDASRWPIVMMHRASWWCDMHQEVENHSCHAMRRSQATLRGTLRERAFCSRSCSRGSHGLRTRARKEQGTYFLSIHHPPFLQRLLGIGLRPAPKWSRLPGAKIGRNLSPESSKTLSIKGSHRQAARSMPTS